MAITRRLKIAAAIVTGCTFAGLLWAHSAGPDPRHTAAPGDDQQACATSGCHVGTLLNGGGGNVQVQFTNGLSYSPGVKQTLTIVITDSKARVYGFQMTARLDSNLANGVAGTFTPDTHQIVICDNNNNRPKTGCANKGVEFIEHSSPYTVNTITVTWTPPATNVGGVHIYIAANAANGNTTETGDHIYTAKYALAPQVTCTETKPAITSGGVLNGASFAKSIQAGAWATIFGTNFNANTRIWDAATEIVDGKLPQIMDGTTVTVGGQPAAIYFISPTQINFQVPDGIGTGPVSVVVGNCAGSSGNEPTQSLKDSPGFFMFDPQGRKYIAALIARSDGGVDYLGPVNLFSGALTTRPVLPGEIVLLFGTGFGPTNPPVTSGQLFSGASPTVDPVIVTVGGVNAQVIFAGISGAGLYQINIVVPNVSAGDQKVVATINSSPSQDGAFITVGSK